MRSRNSVISHCKNNSRWNNLSLIFLLPIGTILSCHPDTFILSIAFFGVSIFSISNMPITSHYSMLGEDRMSIAIYEVPTVANIKAMNSSWATNHAFLRVLYTED